MKRLALQGAVLIVATALLGACASARPGTGATSDRFEGTASWYGEEFAGRTTANGEIFDPLRLTAAHRTLPFGTRLEVTNPENGRTVEVRINDRGPFVGDRILDLSYAAARELGMVEAGIGRIRARIIALGRGDREPPHPYVVTINPPTESIQPPDGPPRVDFPLPGGREAAVEPDPAADVVVDDVVVIEERGGERVLRRVAADGTTIETVTESGEVVAREAPVTVPRRSSPPRQPPPVVPGAYVVQLGAFGVEENAEVLRKKVAPSDASVFVERRSGLWRVRIGPYSTREAAQAAADRLARAGFPGIILSQ